jgi:hypothetical protein
MGCVKGDEANGATAEGGAVSSEGRGATTRRNTPGAGTGEKIGMNDEKGFNTRLGWMEGGETCFTRRLMTTRRIIEKRS